MPTRRIICFSPIIFPLSFRKQTAHVSWVLGYEAPFTVFNFSLGHSHLSSLAWLGAISLWKVSTQHTLGRSQGPWRLIPSPPALEGSGVTDVRNSICPSWEDCLAYIWPTAWQRPWMIWYSKDLGRGQGGDKPSLHTSEFMCQCLQMAQMQASKPFLIPSLVSLSKHKLGIASSKTCKVLVYNRTKCQNTLVLSTKSLFLQPLAMAWALPCCL